ncbi:MAG: mercuric transporter MerT family protein [Hyphomicrobiaceae bacterium]
MAETTRTPVTVTTTEGSGGERSRVRLIAAGGILGALAASSCCILPLVLFSLGISGAWISNFTALAPYKPYFAAATLALLSYGYYLVYVKPKQACADGSCERPLPNRLVKSSLWIATVLVVAALAFDYIAPLLLE